MGKLAVFFIILALVLIYPIYEIANEKEIKYSKTPKNLSLVTIKNGHFFKYETNLTKSGNFKKLDIYKKYYEALDLNITDLEKNETFNAKKAKYISDILYAYDFFYHNNEYNFTSDFVEYNTKLKNFKGNKFLLLGKTFKVVGEKFFIDKYRNIKAYKPIFDLKVKK